MDPSSPRLPRFSDADFDALDTWLRSRRTGITDIVELEGFLTAIVIGPNTMLPSLWLPKVWGGKKPKFKDLAELNRFLAFVMAFYNDIVACFDADPDAFQPTFYERKVGRRTIMIVDEWCFGFFKGTRVDSAGWKPLKRERPELLKPLQLFGSPAGWREAEAGGAAKMHATWSVRIAPAVREIYRYWLPYRAALQARPASDRRH